MSMCLIVNDDLHKTFERYRAIKKGRKPEKFEPGESKTQTLLTPSHIYTQASSNANSNSENHGGPAQVQKPAADVDLFDLMGNNSQPAQP